MPLDAVQQMFPKGLGGLSGFSYQPMVASSAAGVLPGSDVQEGSGPYGAVPQVPSPQASQAAAMQGNISNLANIQQLMAALDQQQAKNVLAPFQQGIPNWGPAMGQAMANVTQGLGGVVNSDVWTNLQRAAAERGVGMGSPLSPNAQTNLLQMLGLTSYGVQQDALKNLLNVMGSIPKISPFNPAQMLVSPTDQQEWQYMANLMRAAPNPALARQEELAALTGGIGSANRGGYYQPSMVTPSGMPSRTPMQQYEADLDRQLADAFARKGDAYGPRTPYAPSSYYGSHYTDPISGQSFSFDPKTGQYVNDSTRERFSREELDYALAPAQEPPQAGMVWDNPLGQWVFPAGYGPETSLGNQASLDSYYFDQPGYEYDPYGDMPGYEVPSDYFG